MQVAILSLCKRQEHSPKRVAGLSRIGNATLLQYHILLAKRAGAQKILCHIDTVPAELTMHEAFAAELGIAWANVRNMQEIIPHIDSNDELLIIADGFFSDAALFDAFVAAHDVDILTADADGKFGGFERLDINTIWAGLLKLSCANLGKLGDVPDDWSLESVFLRQAIAAKSKMRMITLRDIESTDLTDAALETIALEKQLLPQSGQAGLWQPFKRLANQAAHAAAPILWRHFVKPFWGDIAASTCMIGALILAWIGYAILPILLSFTAYFALHIFDLCARPLRAEKQQKLRYMVFLTAAFIGLALIMMGHLQFVTAQLFTVSILNAIGLFTALQWAMAQMLKTKTVMAQTWYAMAFDPLLQAIYLVLSAYMLVFSQGVFLLIAAQFSGIIASHLSWDNAALTKG